MQVVDNGEERGVVEYPKEKDRWLEYTKPPVVLTWPPPPYGGVWDCRGEKIKGTLRVDKNREFEVELEANTSADWQPRLRITALLCLDDDDGFDIGQVDPVPPVNHARTRTGLSLSHQEVTNVWRDAEVLPQSGDRAVSGLINSNWSSGRPNASAQICGITVLEPCPMSVAP